MISLMESKVQLLPLEEKFRNVICVNSNEKYQKNTAKMYPE